MTPNRPAQPLPSLYEQNRSWADRFIEPITQIIRHNSHDIITVDLATSTQDMEEATDLVVHVQRGRIGVRVRRDHIRYRDMTIGIRSRDRNGKTEAEKMLAGDPRWYLYCWTNDDRIAEWMFVDVPALVQCRRLDLAGRVDAAPIDGKKGFVAISIQELVEAKALVRYERRVM